jgi:hypothetical protein
VSARFGAFGAAVRGWLDRRPRARRGLSIVAIFVAWAVAVAVWAPFIASPHVDNGLSDWSYRTDYNAYALNAIVHDHQFPYWVTLPRFEQFRIKGIHDFFANPETEVLSIVTPLAAAFDYLVAVKIQLVVCLLVGVIGCRRLLRTFGGSGAFLTTLLLALLVLANGALVAHTLMGHTQFLTVAIMPLAFALLVDAWEARIPPSARVLRAGGAGAVLAVCYYAGNVHPLIQFFFFMGLFIGGSILLNPRATPRILLVAGATAVWFLALAAFKLVPGMLDFREYRANHFLAYDGWLDLARNFVTPWRLGQSYLRHEFNAYVGWVGVAVLAFAVLGWNRRTVPLVVAALVLSWMMVIKAGNPLLELPVLRTQGVYTRLRIWVIFALALAAVVRIEAWTAWLRRRGGARASIVIAVALLEVDGYLAVDLGRVNVADDVSLSCVHDLPKAEGPFDAPPRFDSQDPARARIVASGARANTFRYRFVQEDGADGTLFVSPDVAVKPHPPHLHVLGSAALTSSGDRLAVRLRGREGEFLLFFFDPATYAALALTIVAWVLLVALTLPRGFYRAIGARLRFVANLRRLRATTF